MMRHVYLFAPALALLLAPAGCELHGHPHGDGHDDHGAHDDHAGHDDHADHDDHGEHGGHGDHAAGAAVYTRWTERTELFVEFPPLVVGKDSAFAAHLTRLSDFRPVAAGRVTVLLAGGGLPEERFEVTQPTVPGIFRPVARPTHAGWRELSILLAAEGLSDRHDLGQVGVFGTPEAAARNATPEEEEGDSISFLKEQQWPIDFATASVEERTLRPSLAVSGTVRARADGEVHVTAPVSGRLLTAGRAFPTLGREVKRDQILVTLAPRLGAEADIASLELAVARAQLDVEHSRRERERLETLLAQGAVPERRVVAARKDEAQAQAELTAAERRLQQHGRVQRAFAGGAGGITVRAPISGTVVAVDVAPGMFLEEGRQMFRIVDLERLWLDVRVPEANIGRVQHAAGAWFTVEGFDEVFDVGPEQVVTTGGVVDARARTIPMIFTIDNPERQLRVGMFARVHLLTGPPVTAPSVPLAAVVGDGGQDVVYVQTGGESFERRLLRPGVRDGDYLQALSGVATGERVVVRGAFMVKLAASTSEVPAHGHAH